MIDNETLRNALQGLKPFAGEYVVMDSDGREVARVHNFLTYAGVDILTGIIAQQITPATWKVGLLSGSVSKDDTEEIHAWTEPVESEGYARQECTVQEVVRTTTSQQTVTALIFSPVTFTCSTDSTDWSKAYTNLFMAMTDSQTPTPHTEIISIGSQLPSPVRLFKGGAYTTAYRLYFRA